ncbi:MAG: hypothetical protein ABIZ04_23310 [Opitutus sp.]
MRSRKNYAILFLTLTTLTGATIAWRQFLELEKLRATALTTDERADWQKRLWATEKRRTELEKEVATLQPKDAGPTLTPEAASADEPRGNRRGGPGNFMAMMERPEVQRMLAMQQKAGLDGNYSALFKNLSLTPEQLDKFKDLLVEKRTAVMDVMSAARQQGINPRSDPEAFQKLVAGAQSDIDASIRATLGDAGFAQYENFEKTMPQRAVVSQLEQRLSYSSTPLTPQQSDQMIAILAATAHARTNTSGAPTPLTALGNGVAATFGGGTGSGSRITDNSINQALGVLAAPQVDALKQLQQEQKAQAALNATMRSRFQGGGATPTPQPATTPGG